VVVALVAVFVVLDFVVDVVAFVVVGFAVEEADVADSVLCLLDVVVRCWWD
jgi:hypothetical protein